MTDYSRRRKPPPSRLLAGFGHIKRGFGAVTLKQKPEDWRKIRVDMEAAGEDSYPVYLLLRSLPVIRKMLANSQQKGVKRH